MRRDKLFSFGAEIPLSLDKDQIEVFSETIYNEWRKAWPEVAALCEEMRAMDDTKQGMFDRYLPTLVDYAGKDKVLGRVAIGALTRIATHAFQSGWNMAEQVKANVVRHAGLAAHSERRNRYVKGYAWIADEDGPADTDNMDEVDAKEHIRGMISVAFLADLYEEDLDVVVHDVYSHRYSAAKKSG